MEQKWARTLTKITSLGFNQSVVEMFSTIVVRFLVLGFNFGATTLITRNLTVEDRGKYGYLYNLIYLMMTFLCFGFHSSTVYILSKNRQYFSYLYTISIMIAAIAFIALSVFSFSGLLNVLCPSFNTLDNTIIIIGTPLILFNYFNSYFFISLNDFKRYNLYEFFKNFCFLFLTVVSLSFAVRYQFYLIFFVIGNLIYVLAASYQFYKWGYLKNNVFYLYKNWKKFVVIFKRSVNMASISYVSCILAFLLGKYILFFIGSYLDIGVEGKKALGYYAVALTNIDISVVLPCTLAFYIFPKISAVNHLKDKLAIVNKMIMLCVVYFGSIAIFSYFFLDQVFSLLYGSAYLASVPMFELLLPAALFLSIISCISSFIGGIGMERTAIYAPLTALLFMVGSSVLLLYSSFDVYNFIYVQNVAYLIYLIIYSRFFLKKWKESKDVKESVCDLSSIIRNE